MANIISRSIDSNAFLKSKKVVYIEMSCASIHEPTKDVYLLRTYSACSETCLVVSKQFVDRNSYAIENYSIVNFGCYGH